MRLSRLLSPCTVFSVVATFFFACVDAHSHMAKPLPTRELHCRVGSQEGRDCYGPCPAMDDYGRVNHPISADHPAETWARGSHVKVRWHRDNHDGTGFVRLSLVPVDKMMEKDAHDKYAFHFVCMNSGGHRCYTRNYDVCGNDAEGMAWMAWVEVPTSYPDGVYVLGWSWYGGGDYRAMSFFGDYYSCSFVKIEGGVAVTEEYHPVWNGQGCVSATDRLGVCWAEPCHVGPTQQMIPAEFNGRHPNPIRRGDVEADNAAPPDPVATPPQGGSSVSFAGNGVSASLGGAPAPAPAPASVPAASSGSQVQATGSGASLTTVASGGSSGTSSAGGSGSSVSLGGSSGSSTVAEGARSVSDEPTDTRVFNSESSSGSLGVFFLDFRTWKKVPILDGGHYSMSNFSQGLTVEAFYNGQVNYIDYFVDGQWVRREKTPPYVMKGNRGRQIFGWRVPLGRMIKLQASVMTPNGYGERFEADVQFD